MRRAAVSQRAGQHRRVLPQHKAAVGHAIAAGVGCAVIDFAVVVGRYCQRRPIHRQGVDASRVGDGVVVAVEGAARCCRRNNVVGAARGGVYGPAAGQRDPTDRLAVFQAAGVIGGGAQVQRGAVGFGLWLRPNGERGTVYRQRAIRIADAVVAGHKGAVGRPTGHNAVRAAADACCIDAAAAGERDPADGFAVLQAGRCEERGVGGVAQRQRVAIGFALGVGRHRERCLRYSKVGGHHGNGVVAVGQRAHAVDGVAADVFTRHTRQRAAKGVAIDQTATGAAGLCGVGVGGVGRTVDLGLAAVGGDVDGARADGVAAIRPPSHRVVGRCAAAVADG